MLEFICYPKCSTCKKAQEFLDKCGVQYSLRDIKLNNPTFEELSLILQKGGFEIKQLFNTSGLLYKELKLKEKLPTMSQEQALILLSTNGMLVKRPILISDDFVLIGFKPDKWQKALS